MRPTAQETQARRPAPERETGAGPALLSLACENASYITGHVRHPNGGTLVGG